MPLLVATPFVWETSTTPTQRIHFTRFKLANHRKIKLKQAGAELCQAPA